MASDEVLSLTSSLIRTFPVLLNKRCDLSRFPMALFTSLLSKVPKCFQIALFLSAFRVSGPPSLVRETKSACSVSKSGFSSSKFAWAA